MKSNKGEVMVVSNDWQKKGRKKPPGGFKKRGAGERKERGWAGFGLPPSKTDYGGLTRAFLVRREPDTRQGGDT